MVSVVCKSLTVQTWDLLPVLLCLFNQLRCGLGGVNAKEVNFVFSEVPERLENGQASRFGIEHDIDMVIILTSSEPVSAEFISDLKRVANEAHADNLNVGVYVIQEAQIKQSKF